MGVWIQPADLAPFAEIDPAKAEAMIADAEAIAVTHAPALATLTMPLPWQSAALLAVLRGAILRWDGAENGDAVTQTSFTVAGMTESQSYQTRRGMFYPSEVEQLKTICKTEDAGKTFYLDVAGDDGFPPHPAWCRWLGNCAQCG